MVLVSRKQIEDERYTRGANAQSRSSHASADESRRVPPIRRSRASRHSRRHRSTSELAPRHPKPHTDRPRAGRRLRTQGIRKVGGEQAWRSASHPHASRGPSDRRRHSTHCPDRCLCRHLRVGWLRQRQLPDVLLRSEHVSDVRSEQPQLLSLHHRLLNSDRPEPAASGKQRAVLGLRHFTLQRRALRESLRRRASTAVHDSPQQLVLRRARSTGRAPPALSRTQTPASPPSTARTAIRPRSPIFPTVLIPSVIAAESAEQHVRLMRSVSFRLAFTSITVLEWL